MKNNTENRPLCSHNRKWASTCEGKPGTKTPADCIIINTRCLSDVKILKVIVHEAYHAYQYQVVDGIIHSNERASIIRLWDKEKDTPVHLNMELSSNWIVGLLNEKDNGIR